MRGADHKQIHGQSRILFERLQPAFLPRQIESAPRRMEEDSPPGGPKEKLDRNPGAMRTEVIAALAAGHGIDLAAPVELRASLSQPKQEPACDIEFHGAGILIDRDLLYETFIGPSNLDDQRMRRNRDGQISGTDRLRLRQ